MFRNLGEVGEWISRLVRRIERLESGAMLENSSITGGRMRFIGGTLRVDSGGRVEIVGSLQIDGTTTINGSTIVNGTFKIEGPWSLNGNGEIAGNVAVTGKLTQNGPWEFIGAGKITGNVDVTGTIRVLAGGKIQVGNIVIDPSISGGAIVFANGAQVFTDASTIQVYKGNGVAQISDTEAKLQLGGVAVRIIGGNLQLLGLPTRSRANANNAVAGSIWSDGTNTYRIVP